MTHLRGVKPPPALDKQPLKKAPPAPKHLSSFARQEWKRIIPGLVDRGVITALDLGGIEDFCRARGLIRELETEIRASGTIDPKLCRLQDKAMQTARQLAAEFGLTPVSRARVGAAPAEDEDDNPLALGRNRP